MEPLVDKKYIIYGEIAVISDNKLEITELPIGTWTQTYKESVLEPMLHGANEKTPPSITYVSIKFCCIFLDHKMENLRKKYFTHILSSNLQICTQKNGSAAFVIV